MSEGYKTRVLMPTDMQVTEQFRMRYAIRIDGDTPVEDMLRPAFWVHVAARFRVFDIIEVLPANQAYYAELMVSKIDTTGTGVKIPSLIVLSHITLGVPQPAAAAAAAAAAVDTAIMPEEVPGTTYQVSWKGPHAKFCIVRKEDRAMIEKNIADKGTAIARVRQLEAA